MNHKKTQVLPNNLENREEKDVRDTYFSHLSKMNFNKKTEIKKILLGYQTFGRGS